VDVFFLKHGVDLIAYVRLLPSASVFPAPLYLRTLWRYTSAVIILIIMATYTFHHVFSPMHTTGLW